MSGKALRWYIAWTQWRAETRARAGLQAAGYEVLVPTKPVEVSHAGKRMMVERPIFPRYVFVGVPDGNSWYPILSTVAVSGLITNSGKPVCVPQWIMRNMLQAYEAGAFAEKVEVEVFGEGQAVRFKGGPFAGFVGKIMSASPARRVQVLVEMFGKKHEFKVPIAQLTAV